MIYTMYSKIIFVILYQKQLLVRKYAIGYRHLDVMPTARITRASHASGGSSPASNSFP